MSGRTHSTLCTPVRRFTAKAKSSAKRRELRKTAILPDYSKFLFDQVRRRMKEGLTAQNRRLPLLQRLRTTRTTQGRIASSRFRHFHQYREHGYVNLFGSNDGYGNGEQTRDFVSVEDVAKVNLYFDVELCGIPTSVPTAANSLTNSPPPPSTPAAPPEGKPEMKLEELVEEELIHLHPTTHSRKYELHPSRHHQIARSGYKEEFFDVKSGVDRYVKWMLENLA